MLRAILGTRPEDGARPFLWPGYDKEDEGELVRFHAESRALLFFKSSRPTPKSHQ